MAITLLIDTGGGSNFENFHLRNVQSLHVGGSALASGAALQVTGILKTSSAVLVPTLRRDVDDSLITLAGGSDGTAATGGIIQASGDTHATTPGYVDIVSGADPASPLIRFITNGTVRGTINKAGLFAWTLAMTVGGTLGVTGVLSTTGNVDVGGILTVVGDAEVQDDLQVDGDLNVDGITTIGDLRPQYPAINLGGALSGSVDIDMSLGEVFHGVTNGNVTFTFSNLPASGKTEFKTIEILHTSAAHTITWPASVKWTNDTAPFPAINGRIQIYVMYTRDGGTKWRANWLPEYAA